MKSRNPKLDEIAKRRESALREQPAVELVKGDIFYGWYKVSGSRGNAYRVETALEARRQATCTCQDFATNRLNTCKHIEAVRLWLATTPEAATWRDPLSICQGTIDELDVVVFDLETQRLFQDVGGRRYMNRLGMSLGVLYSLQDNTYTTYFETQTDTLISRISQADLAVGFNIINFDYPVLEPYGGYSVYKTPTLDMMLLVEDVLGFRLGLDTLAQGTLGTGKTADGLKAVEWYRTGRLDLLEQYCRADVTVTTQLFLHGLREGYVRYLGRDGVLHTVSASWHAATTHAAG